MGAVKCSPLSAQQISKPVTPNETHPLSLPSLSHMKEEKLSHQDKKHDHQGHKHDHQDHKLGHKQDLKLTHQAHQEKSNQHHKGV